MKRKIAAIYNNNYNPPAGDGFKVINIFPNGYNLCDKIVLEGKLKFNDIATDRAKFGYLEEE